MRGDKRLNGILLLEYASRFCPTFCLTPIPFVRGRVHSYSRRKEKRREKMNDKRIFLCTLYFIYIYISPPSRVILDMLQWAKVSSSITYFKDEYYSSSSSFFFVLCFSLLISFFEITYPSKQFLHLVGNEVYTVCQKKCISLSVHLTISLYSQTKILILCTSLEDRICMHVVRYHEEVKKKKREKRKKGARERGCEKYIE